MVVEKFQVYSVKFTANTFVSQNFLLMPPSKSQPQVYSPVRQEFPISPKQRFLKRFFPEEKGWGRGEQGAGLWSSKNNQN